MDYSEDVGIGNIPLLSNVVQEKARKVFKSRFERSEKRASIQAYATKIDCYGGRCLENLANKLFSL